MRVYIHERLPDGTIAKLTLRVQSINCDIHLERHPSSYWYMTFRDLDIVARVMPPSVVTWQDAVARAHETLKYEYARIMRELDRPIENMPTENI